MKEVLKNNIQDDIVSFELARLLKVNGFKSKSKYYDGSGKIVKTPDTIGNDYRHTNNMMQRFRYEAPTLGVVQKWIYVNFGIWIYTYSIAPFIDDESNYPKIVWICKVQKYKEYDIFITADNQLAINHHRTQVDAMEAGMLHTLKELI